MKTLNEVFTKLTMRRRYEVWFLRVGLGDGSGAWWFRYLLMNPGRGGCAGDAQGQAVQVWATWFPREGKAETWIQGFPVESLRPKDTASRNAGVGEEGLSKASSKGSGLSRRGASPFFLEIRENRIGEDACQGRTDAGGAASLAGFWGRLAALGGTRRKRGGSGS